MRKLSLTVIFAGFLATSASAACLEDLTDATVEAKQCTNTGGDCQSRYRAFEIQRLTCIRDGLERERIEAAILLGDAMVVGDRKPNPTSDWVSLRVTELVKDSLNSIENRLDAIEKNGGAVNAGTADLPVALESRLNMIEQRLKAIDASRASLNAELLKVQGQVNGLMLDRSVR